jgi:hypothetical protein
VHVRVGSALELTSTPAQSCLLAVHNELDIVAVGSQKGKRRTDSLTSDISIHKLDTLAAALESGSRDVTPESEPVNVISVPATPLFVRFANAKVVASFGSTVVVWDVTGKVCAVYSSLTVVTA